jgi:hypothetical protein
MDYHEYLLSEQWAEKTAPVRRRLNGMCECCNMRFGSEVHHRTYVRLFNELPEDLIHLCGQCHEAVHGLDTCFIWPSRKVVLHTLQREALANVR